MEPPLAKDLGFKHNSQTTRIYSLLYSARTMSGLKVPRSVILDYCKTTNHRRIRCDINEALAKPTIIERFGVWQIPPAEVKLRPNGSNESYYWLEYVERYY